MTTIKRIIIVIIIIIIIKNNNRINKSIKINNIVNDIIKINSYKNSFYINKFSELFYNKLTTINCLCKNSISKRSRVKV